MTLVTASVRTKIVAALSAAAIALGVGVASAGAAQAATDTGSISGTVTLPEGAPSEWMNGVAIWVTSDGYSKAEMVEPDGTYTIPDLPPGSYTMELWTERYWDEQANIGVVPPVLETHSEGSPFGPNAVPLVVDGSAITGIDLQLQYGYSVTGTVTAPGGKVDPSLVGVRVNAIGEDGTVVLGSVDDSRTGAFSTGLVPAGNYVIEFIPESYVDPATNRSAPPRLQGEFYDNAKTIANATVIEITDANVTGIDAELALLPTSKGFLDVSSNSKSPHYTQFHREIQWLADRGISTGWDVGNGNKEFRAKSAISRDAMAAFLYRLAGSPDVTLPQRSPFTDVKPSAQFYKEIVWLSQQGISTGWDVGGGNKEYRGKESITRDAMAAFLYRAAGKPAVSLKGSTPFTDVSSSGTKFYTEIRWLEGQGISNGWSMGGGKYEFRPYNDITREAMAAFLYRYAAL